MLVNLQVATPEFIFVKYLSNFCQQTYKLQTAEVEHKILKTKILNFLNFQLLWLIIFEYYTGGCGSDDGHYQGVPF